MQLQLFEFLSLLTRLCFLKANPRYGKSGPKGQAAPEIIPVPTCLRKFVGEALPKLPKRPGKFRDMLAADAAAQKVLASHDEKPVTTSYFLLPAHCSLRTAYPLLLTPCQVLASYADKLQAWHARFVEGAKGGAALYTHWESQLQACHLVITPRDGADCLQACPLRVG